MEFQEKLNSKDILKPELSIIQTESLHGAEWSLSTDLGRTLESIHLEPAQKPPGAHTRSGWAGWAGSGSFHWLGWLIGKLYLATIQKLVRITI